MTLIVAEISCSHEGDYSKALQLIDAAADAKADYVKFQLFTPDDMTLDSDDPRFTLQSGPWKGRKLYDLYAEAMTPREWFPDLFAYAREKGIKPFTTVCNPNDIEFLESLDCPMYKVASAELPWLDLVRACAEPGKPVVLSTGMATDNEIGNAVWAARPTCNTVYPMHCVSGYPTPVEQMRLGRMDDLKVWGRVGLSDHSRGSLAATLAVALGAEMIEKHIMLPWPNKSLDRDFALEPAEFRSFVHDVRQAEKALAPSACPAEEHSHGFKRRLVGNRWVRCAA